MATAMRAAARPHSKAEALASFGWTVGQSDPEAAYATKSSLCKPVVAKW